MLKPSPNNRSYKEILKFRVDKNNTAYIKGHCFDVLKTSIKLGTVFEDRDDDLNYGIFRVHMKDHKKVQAGKRQSQCLYSAFQKKLSFFIFHFFPCVSDSLVTVG